MPLDPHKNELSLFSGSGGGLLTSKLLGWKTIGYVEVYFDLIIHETDDAYLFGIDDEETWIAKSQCEITEPGIVEMSEWVAIKKGLV